MSGVTAYAFSTRCIRRIRFPCGNLAVHILPSYKQVLATLVRENALGIERCMIKIFWGGRGGDIFKTLSPYEQVLPLPTPPFQDVSRKIP